MNTDELFTQLEQVGEDTVRKNLAGKGYRSDKIPIVLEWLRRKEEGRGYQFNKDLVRATQRSAIAAKIAALAAVVSAIFAGLVAWKMYYP